MKALGNVLVACFLAVVAGAAVFFLVQPGEADAVSKETDPTKRKRVFENPLDARPQPSETGPQPKLVCEQKLFKFGLMELGTERSHVFKIRNDGEGDLVMKTGTPTCKCTHFELSKPTLKPGEVCEVLLTWKPVSESQVFAQRAPIHTNDPALHPEPFWLEIEGSVANAISIEPEDVWQAGTISADVATEIRGVIYSRLTKDFEIKDLKADDEGLTIKTVRLTEEQLSELTGAKVGYEIFGSISPDGPLGKYSQRFSFSIESKEYEVQDPDRVYTVAMNGHKLGPIEFVPMFGVQYNREIGRISIGEFSASEGKEAKMLVFVTPAKDAPEFKVEDIEVSAPNVKVEMVEQKTKSKKKRFELRVRVLPGQQTANREGKKAVEINIKTNHPKAADIPLRVGYFSI